MSDWLVRSAVAVLVLAVWQCGGLDRAATLELKFGHVAQPGSLIAVSAEEFARRANEKLGASARVIVVDVVVGDIRLGHGFRDDAEFDDAVQRDGKSVL